MTGEFLGHYRVLEKIGSGGMGEVYRASDDRLGREVAIKILQSSYSGEQDRLRRFEQEARAAAALNHPNILAIYDMGVQNGAPYIVSELLRGKTLRDGLREGPISPRLATDYAGQIAQGLMAAHEKGIVHRDLKPENLFITQDGRVKILDFGIAKLTAPDADGDRSATTMTTQTRSGSVLGTAAYMSPEQLRGKPVDARSDIFSFGAILYEMLIGKRAFSGETHVDTMTAVLREEPQELTSDHSALPPAFDGIVRHCLEKEPEHRFQSARDLAFALGEMAGDSTKTVSDFRRLKPQARRWMPWLAAAVLVAGVGVLVGAALKPATTPEYRRLTFERGTVYAARFSSDGHSVIYSAAWNGRPMEIYSTVPDSALANPLTFTSSHLLGVSRTNELALLLRGVHGERLEFEHGTLARAPMAGGAPREIMQDVKWADWSPSGDLAVVRRSNGRDVLEYPMGKVLYETVGTISNPRFAPDGSKIAFMDHPVRFDDKGSVCVVDLQGKSRALSREWGSEAGLAWSPRGNEVWFTAVEHGSTNRAVFAVSMTGKERKVLVVPGGFTLEDIAADGRVLADFGSERLAMEWMGKDRGTEKSRDLSWYDWTLAKDISPDKQWVLFEESSEAAGSDDAVAIRKVDGTPPIHLGDGSGAHFSPDGKWVLSVSQDDPVTITLLPVGPGQPRVVAVPSLKHLQFGANFLPDGRIVVNGNELGHNVRTYLVDASTGQATPVTPEGVAAAMPSPDGRYLAGVGAGHKLTLYPVAGGARREIATLDPDQQCMQWSADSTAIYTYRFGYVPLKLERLDLASGKSTPVRELVPEDRAGVVSIGPAIGSRDGTDFAYSYYQMISALYVISGLN